MEEFIVSARKYRPHTFDDVVGQLHITGTLQNAIRNQKVAHAFLFCGPRGVGKTTCARILAKTLNCLNLKETMEPCNTCDSCLGFNASHSFNIHELDAASNNSVDDIRQLIDQVRIPPQIGKYSVFIIDEVHMLSQSAFNAFLKTLEEPPNHAIFILATTEKHKILPTILSRCQVFDFHRITIDDMSSHLGKIAVKEGIEAEPSALHVIAQKADGGLRDALSIFDRIVTFAGNNISYKDVIENLNILDLDYFFKVSASALAGDRQALLLLFDEVLSNGFEGSTFISGLADHYRDLLVSLDTQTIKLLEVGDEFKARYEKEVPKFQASYLLEAMKIINHADLGYRTATNKRLLVELTLLQIAELSEKKNRVVVAQEEILVPEKQAKDLVMEDKLVAAIPAKKVVLTKSISIKNPVTAVETAVEEEAEGYIKPKDAFSQEQLTEAWETFAHKLKSEGKSSLFSMLTSYKPVLKEDYTVWFPLDHKAQLLSFDEFKTDFTQSLRKQFNNAYIQIITEIQQVSVNRKPFSAEEKFEIMAKENPHLQLLRKQFGLDLEF